MSVSYTTRVRLALLSGNLCAMPSCRQLLSEYPSGIRNEPLLGDAAHIAGEHGGKDGGRPSARYDKTMTPEERNSLSNLIFVCKICHAKIDAYPHGEQDYPVDRLLSIKKDHESMVASVLDEAKATVGFKELEMATQWVSEVPPPPQDLDFQRISIMGKIQKHGLSVQSQNHIISHLAAMPQVRSFIQSLNQEDPTFPDRLKWGFLGRYAELRREGKSSGEDLFSEMCMFARRGFTDIRIQNAAETVLVYLFETCEVFER